MFLTLGALFRPGRVPVRVPGILRKNFKSKYIASPPEMKKQLLTQRLAQSKRLSIVAKSKPMIPNPTIFKRDLVQVLLGPDAGKRGKVIRVIQKSGRIVVQGINLKNVKHKHMEDIWGTVQFPQSIPYEHVSLIDPKLNIPCKVDWADILVNDKKQAVDGNELVDFEATIAKTKRMEKEFRENLLKAAQERAVKARQEMNDIKAGKIRTKHKKITLKRLWRRTQIKKQALLALPRPIPPNHVRVRMSLKTGAIVSLPERMQLKLHRQRKSPSTQLIQAYKKYARRVKGSYKVTSGKDIVAHTYVPTVRDFKQTILKSLAHRFK